MNYENLPAGWVIVTLKDILQEFLSGKRPQGGVQHITEGIPSLGGEHLNYSGGFNFDNIKYVPVDFAKKLDKVKLAKDDILIVKDGATTGKISFVDHDFPFAHAVINEHLFLCRFYAEINKKFIFYFLFSVQGNKQILLNFHGSAQGGINKSFVDHVIVPLPPLNEQIRIVAKIEALQAKIKQAKAQLERVQILLKKFRILILRKAFKGQLTEKWRAENPQTESAELLLEKIKIARRKKWEDSELEKMKAKGITPKDDKWKDKYKESETVKNNYGNQHILYDLPEGWLWVNLEQLFNHFQYGYTASANAKIKNIKLFRITDIQNQIVNWDTVPGCEISEKDFKKYALENGDFVFARMGSIEKTAMIRNVPVAVFASYLIRSKPVMSDISLWIEKFLQTSSYIIQINKISRGTTRDNVNAQNLAKITIPLPPLAEQQEIVKKLTQIFQFADIVEEKVTESLKNLERLNRKILGKAFRGELVPQDPNDEPASILLERIKSQKLEEKPKKRRKS